jgi:hypothetical protein
MSFLEQSILTEKEDRVMESTDGELVMAIGQLPL